MYLHKEKVIIKNINMVDIIFWSKELFCLISNFIWIRCFICYRGNHWITSDFYWEYLCPLHNWPDGFSFPGEYFNGPFYFFFDRSNFRFCTRAFGFKAQSGWGYKFFFLDILKINCIFVESTTFINHKNLSVWI
mgnify:CR=1 FL=1